MIVTIFISVCLFVLFAIFNLWIRKRNFRATGVRDLPPTYPGAIPFIGHAHLLLGDHEHLFKLMNSTSKESLDKGGVVVFKIGSDNYYIITDPDDFTTAGNQCLQKHFAYNFFKPWVGNGLISGTDLVVWKRHRKLLHPAFNQQVLNGFLDIFNQQAKQLIDDLASEAGQGPFDHTCYLEQIGLETVCKTVFGIHTDEDKLFDKKKYMTAVGEMLNIIGRRFQSPWMHNDILYNMTSTKKKQDAHVKYLNDTCEAVLQRKIHLHANVGYNTKHKAFTDRIVELSAEGRMTHKEIWEEVNTLIVAGYETSANTLMYTSILIGTHSQVQKNILMELQEAFGDSKRDVEKSDLTKLVYLEAVIKETMRLYPVTPVLLRQVDEVVRLKNYTMPAGSNCILLMHGLHRHSIWGSDVEQFRPERWLDPASLSDPNSALHTAFAGFGTGKRLCMGKSYALMSMKTSLAHLLRQYKVTSGDVTKLVFQLNGMLKPVSGHHISIEKRRG